MLGKLKVSPRNSLRISSINYFLREQKIYRPLFFRIASTTLFPLAYALKNAASFKTRKQIFRYRAPLFTHVIASFLDLLLTSTLGWHRPGSPSARSQIPTRSSSGVGLGCLRLRASNEGLLRPRVARAKKTPSLTPASSSTTHSLSQDSPCRRSPSSPVRLRIQALAACLL